MAEARVVAGDVEHIFDGERKPVQRPAARGFQGHMIDTAEGA
jgi:hypothetical protein